ncbi:MAG: hypothetical protein ACKO96_06730 [Flammeovirgaceae bacterium]
MKSKIGYGFIALFAVWCVIASQWYLFGIKGLQADPSHFQPHQTSVGIIELASILLITVLLGFGIAWFLRQSTIDKKVGHIQQLKQKAEQQYEQQHEWLARVEKAETTLSRARETFKLDFLALADENDRLKKERDRLQHELQELQSELQVLRPKVQQADSELGRITMQFQKLETQLEAYIQKNQELTAQLHHAKSAPALTSQNAVESSKETSRLMRLEKDDLKRIVGIGPKIEKKLNKLGVYTFEQIRDLTPEMMEHITAKLKSFPDRIARDNWVGQAKQLIRRQEKQ